MTTTYQNFEKNRYHDLANKPKAKNCTAWGQICLKFCFGCLGSYYPHPKWIFEDTILIRWMNIGWGGLEEVDIVTMHCQSRPPPITTQKAQHTKVSQDDIFLGGGEGGYLSLLMETETSILFLSSCRCNSLATSPPNMWSHLVIPSSPIDIPPSSHPLPRPPPLTPTHQFLWWQAPVPDRHQRAGNIGILCHRFCSDRCLEKGTILDAI